MTCPHCGTEIAAGATGCPSCGSAFSSGPVTAVTSLGGDDETHLSGPGGAVPRRGATGPLGIGSAFGTRYRILRELGAGGMGVVYQAWDEELGMAVALKVIRPEVDEDPYAAREVERRFKRELVLARQVTHKHVVRIHDLGEVNGIKYLTMPFVDGRNLADILAESGSLAVPHAVRLARQIASGLQAAHEAGVVHRDLKPENVMIDADGQALIMDFGISRSATGTGNLTAMGSVVGTLEYMAPEQGRGGQVDQRADIYSFGLILYDALAGRHRQKKAESAVAEMVGRMQKPPDPLRAVAPHVPEAVEALVMRCLAPDAAERYADAAALNEALQALDDDGHAAHAAAPARRGLRPAEALVAALLLVAGIVAGGLWVGRSSPAAPAAARDPMSVLIADFDNRVDDPVFTGSLEQALAIAMEGAPFITSYPRTGARALASQIAQRPALTEDAALLVARREGVHVILAGVVDSAGAGYRLSLRAVNVPDEQPLASVSAAAASKAEVLPAVAKLAADMRAALGDAAAGADVSMETFTASTLEAMRQYAVAQDHQARGRHAEAVTHYQAAIDADPQFGRAYSGMATSYFYMGQRQEAEKMWEQAVRHMDRMTARERYRTRGTYFLAVTQDYDKAIEEYSNLVRLYPADRVGHNNLAFAYFATLDFDKAREGGRRALELAPNNATIHSNYALYAMYAGDFATAVEEATRLIAINDSFFKAYLPLAMAALVEGDEQGAADAYARMAKTDALGASAATLGLADIAMRGGRWDEAVRLLEAGLVDDRASKNQSSIGAKTIALAEIQLMRGNAAAARRLAGEALSVAPRDDDVMVLAGAIFAQVGDHAAVRALIAELDAMLQPRPRAYARILEGDLALARGQTGQALEAYREAKDSADLWLARFRLGVASVAAGRFVDASAEFDRCADRLGEVTALFFDSSKPTFRYAAPLAYWRGRTQEGLRQTAAAIASYEAFLKLRPDDVDPLAADARKRLAGLQ
jgi:eukaryotic-like serine/threonine-protein kinase